MSEPTTPTYAQLAEYLAYLVTLADITGGLVDLDTIRPLAQEVRLAAVKSLLYARQSNLLDQDNVEQFPLFLELLNGVAIEVETLVGTDPADPIRMLAVQAVTLGTAAQIEFAAYPEQQLGDFARANQLQGRYEALLARLKQAVADSTPDGALPPTAMAPRGCFPSAHTYPDAAEPCYPGYAPRYGN